MNKKSRYTFFIFLTLFLVLTLELFYVNFTNGVDKTSLEKKEQFVKLTTLPDLAIFSDTSYIRHRSLANVASIYKDDGSLREYSILSYAISDSKIKKNYEK